VHFITTTGETTIPGISKTKQERTTNMGDKSPKATSKKATQKTKVKVAAKKAPVAAKPAAKKK